MKISCDSCKTGYTEEEFYDICAPIGDDLYRYVAALVEGVTIDVRRCECCGAPIRFITTTKLGDTPCQNQEATKNQ
jgi:hypothetical protein